MDSKGERISLLDITAQTKRQSHVQRTKLMETALSGGDAPPDKPRDRPMGAGKQPEISRARPTTAATVTVHTNDETNCSSGVSCNSVDAIPSRSEINNNASYSLQQPADSSTYTERGKYQSPVDISDVSVVQDISLRELCYGYHRDESAMFVNDGVLPRCDVSQGIHIIRGGPLLCDYALAQFHFHFAGSGSNGSEHALNGKRYPAEVHFVHYKTQYRNFEAALKHKDGLAVVGALLDVSDPPDITTAAFDKDIQNFKLTKATGSSYRTPVDLSSYGLGSIEDYFTYNGSLTSPPCYECVCWLVLCRPITISSESYRALTQLFSVDGGLISKKGNFRQLQPLNDRIIRRSFCAMSRVLHIFRNSGIRQ